MSAGATGDQEYGYETGYQPPQAHEIEETPNEGSESQQFAPTDYAEQPESQDLQSSSYKDFKPPDIDVSSTGSNSWNNAPWKADPKCKLFIRLPKADFQNTTEVALENAFREVLGEAAMYAEFSPTLNKGYCFLMFQDRLTCALAHDLLFQKAILGTVVKPNYSFTKNEQMAVSAGVKDEEIERNHRTAVVKRLANTITEDQVKEYFLQFGAIKSCKLINKRASIAFIVFQNHYPAMLAVEQANGADLFGSTMQVSLSENTNLKRRAAKFQLMNNGGYGGGFGGGYGGGFGGYGGGWGMGRGGYGGGWGNWGGRGASGGWKGNGSRGFRSRGRGRGRGFQKWSPY